MAWNERYVRADAAGGGNGTTDVNSGANGAFTLVEAITHSTTNTGVRYNVRAGTYAQAATARNFSGIGTTTAPNWWRGFSVTPGDLDNDPVSAKPSITFTSASLAIGGAHQKLTNLSILGTANSAALVNVTGAHVEIDRCRIDNQSANGTARAASLGAQCRVTRSLLKATTTADQCVGTGGELHLQGNAIIGGQVGFNLAQQAVCAIFNIFRGQTSHGINLSSGTSRPAYILSNTFRGQGGDGIRFSALPSVGVINNNLFAGIVGTAINNASGANTNVISRLGNAFWNCGAIEAGFGDTPSLMQIIESADPNISATDLALILTALSVNGGQPGLFEGEGYTSYLDIGAVQRIASAGGGLLMQRGFTGGIPV